MSETFYRGYDKATPQQKSIPSLPCAGFLVPSPPVKAYGHLRLKQGWVLETPRMGGSVEHRALTALRSPLIKLQISLPSLILQSKKNGSLEE